MSTIKVNTLTTLDGTGNITLSRPIVGDGSNLTGVAPTKTSIEALGIDLPAANLTGTIHADRYTNTIPDATNVASAGAGMLTVDQSWTGSQRATLVTDNDGNFDLNAGQNFKCTPTAGLTLTFTNFANGQSGFIILVNSGGHAIARHGDTIADANFVATVSTAGTYIISYISDGTDAFLTNSAIMA